MITLEDVLAIIGALESAPDMSAFDPNDTFSNNGIDSLDFMSVLLEIEERCEFKFTDAELEKVKTAKDLVAAVERRLAAR